jgi:DNA-binding response OmpR family regulator
VRTPKTITCTIAIVEDDPRLRSLLTLILASEGFSVTSFVDAETAMTAFLLQPPSVLLLDQMLPGMTGLELLGRLRFHGLGCPVLMITALQDPTFDRCAIEAGADAVLGKPFDVDRLLAWVLQQRPQVG